MLTPRSFTMGDRFRWRDKVWQVTRELPDDEVAIEEIGESLSLGRAETHTRLELAAALFGGALEFVFIGRDGRIKSRRLTLDDYAEHRALIAQWRERAVTKLLAIDRKERTAERVRDVVAVLRAELGDTYMPWRRRGPADGPAPKKTRAQRKEEGPRLLHAVSYVSLYRWLGDYIANDRDPCALILDTGNCGSGKAMSLPKAIDNIIIESIAEVRGKRREFRSVKDVQHEAAVRVAHTNRTLPSHAHLTEPSISTVRRRLQGLDLCTEFMRRHGKEAADRAFAQYGRMERPTLPMERMEMDFTRPDLFVIDDKDSLPLGRPTFTYGLDIATGYPGGHYLGFERESYMAIAEALYYIIWPKVDAQGHGVRERYGTRHDWPVCGVPFTLAVDNGKAFIGKDLKDACHELGINLVICPVRSPHLKGHVERSLGALNKYFWHKIPGTAFSNIMQRGDYESLKEACVYQSELEGMFVRTLVDIYAEDFHKGIDGIPARRWEAAVADGWRPRYPASAEQLRLILGRVKYRKIHHYGIDIDCLRYQSDELSYLRKWMGNKQAKVKSFPWDLGKIAVLDTYPGDGEQPHYIEIPVQPHFDDYVQGMSQYKHRLIRQITVAGQDKPDHVALGEAKRRLQSDIDEQMHRKKVSTRAKAERLRNSGKPLRDLPSDDGSTPNKGANASPTTPPARTPVVPPHVEQHTPTAVPTDRAPDLDALLMDDEEAEGGTAAQPAHRCMDTRSGRQTKRRT
jgi:putative transposase